MFEGLMAPTHLIVLLVVVMLLFGAKRIPEVGRSLGAGLRGFQEGVTGTAAQHVEPVAESTHSEAE
jgi:sec-independent protein translocase protein TatA